VITPVGFGSWAIGGAGWQFAWGAQDDRASIAAIHRALEQGVNWIDTAAVYGMGHSEEVVARALKTWPGGRPYVFTLKFLQAGFESYLWSQFVYPRFFGGIGSRATGFQAVIHIKTLPLWFAGLNSGEEVTQGMRQRVSSSRQMDVRPVQQGAPGV